MSRQPQIAVIGAGPGGLYFAILAKQAFPEVAIRVLERNRPDDTFGFGVVFSDETLGNFERADAEIYAAITARFRSWRDIETIYGGERILSRGHGFAALGRRDLLLILQERCRRLGVELTFEREVASAGSLRDADLVVAADGVNSAVRREYEQAFEPSVEWGECRFCWLGMDRALAAFTFLFHESEHGLFQIHAYPFAERASTWIVECHEETWRRAGLDRASEEETVAICERLFEPWLGGARLLSNRSIWRRFPTVRCARWWHERTVLLGDAAHTAHFSIGSGTKLAMEDSIALAAALAAQGWRGSGTGSLAAALAAYEEARRVDVLKLQKAAETSRRWFESSRRYLGQAPLQFTFNLLTRSQRITYDNLRERDPQLVARVDAWFRSHARGEPDAAGPHGAAADLAAPPLFTPFRLRGLELSNRIVVSPMCQYSAADGTPNDWHLVHLGSRAIGGAALVMTEMTDVEPEGRISCACTGMYRSEHATAWRRIVDFVHAHSGAAIGLQLAHAGRKGSVLHPWDGEDEPLAAEDGAWRTYAPSAIPFRSGWPVPKEMDEADMERVLAAFVQATRWAEEAGFDLVELHLAHGYLLSSFLSPLSNRRRDRWGGSLENRLRFPLAVFTAMRAVWPPDRPLIARITASDWMSDGSGTTPDEAVEVARALKAAGCDAVDVSSGGNAPGSRPLYGRMYQVPFADRIRHEAGIPVLAVGALLGADHANTVLAAGRADLAVMARPHLRDPYLTLHAAERYGITGPPWPPQYLPARPRPR